ncbi:MAG: RNA polymerase sigma factor [Mariniblastus sp.]
MKPLHKRLHQGNASAFVELYDLLGQKLFRYVFAQVGSSDDAADIVQETFVRLVKSHRALAKAENINSYVFAATRNEMIRWIKKHQKHKCQKTFTAEGDGFSEPASLNLLAIDIDNDDWIENVLSKLDPIDQELVQLKIFSQLTFGEIADVTGIAKSNVATRYRRAIAKLESSMSSVSEDLRLESKS